MRNKDYIKRTTIERLTSMITVIKRKDGNELALYAPQIELLLEDTVKRLIKLEALRRDKTIYPEEG